MAACQISIQNDLRGPVVTSVAACASGVQAFVEAQRMIEHGDAEVVIAGGTESAILPVAFAALANMGALSKRKGEPERASRPFDAGRDGFVMGEAGAVLVLEELEHAQARGAKIYAEVGGYGLSSDAKHITEPDPTGPVRAFEMALNDAGVGKDAIDYINAHATSTPVGDASETKMLKLALGEDNARSTPVSGTKGATGHCLGAAGAIEAIFTVLAIRDGTLPPTINYEVEDPECDLDYVPNTARDAEVNTAVSNSFGFGGHNACVVFQKFAA
jgi:3-oxoacyl-[acyl-carrier-protein] synthase II